MVLAPSDVRGTSGHGLGPLVLECEVVGVEVALEDLIAEGILEGAKVAIVVACRAKLLVLRRYLESPLGHIEARDELFPPQSGLKRVLLDYRASVSKRSFYQGCLVRAAHGLDVLQRDSQFALLREGSAHVRVSATAVDAPQHLVIAKGGEVLDTSLSVLMISLQSKKVSI